MNRYGLHLNKWAVGVTTPSSGGCWGTAAPSTDAPHCRVPGCPAGVWVLPPTGGSPCLY